MYIQWNTRRRGQVTIISKGKEYEYNSKTDRKERFSASESKIADYIIENKEEILHLTIRELAKTTYTGASTVMRVIKKIYDGSFSVLRSI